MEGRIRCVLKPALNENAVIRLQRKVLGYVVHNDGLVKRAPDSRQVLDEDHAGRTRMLPIEAVGDVFRLVDRVEDPVSVVLHRGRENHDFVDISHFFQEFLAAWSYTEIAFSVDFIVVN